MRGFDISHYQKGLTIRQLRDAGGEFVIIKLSEGDRLPDSAAFGFYHEAYELGFPVGCYCYSHATTPEQAVREAEFLLKTINGFPMPCGVFLDVEDAKVLGLPHDALLGVVLTWCEKISATGYVPGVYGSEYNLWAKLSPEQLPADALAWVAHYGKQPDVACDIWQSGDDGHIPGFDGQLDIDEARSARFRKLVEQARLPAPRAAETEPDPIVMQMQACMRYAGCWPEEIDGVRSGRFRERLCQYARG